MAEDSYVRIEVGLDGGQVLSVLVTAESAADLEHALNASANSTIALESQDGALHVVVPRVLYVKRFAREGRVGFGH